MSRMLLLAGVVGFASGILCRSFLVFSWQWLLYPFLLLVLVLGYWFLHRRLVYLCVALTLFGFVAGAGRTMLASQEAPSWLMAEIGETVLYEGIIVREPDIRETSQRIVIQIEDAAVLAVAPLYPEVSYGDRVIVTGSLASPDPFDTNGGRVFRYDQFLAKDGIFVLIERAQLKVLETPKDLMGSGMRMLFSLKQSFQKGLAAALPEPSSSLASGLITGGKQGLGSELLNAFVIAGLVHIVVLSGYNVMIVAEAVLRVLGFIPKRIAAVAAGLTIGLFVLIAGAGAASVRAGIMAGLALLARATGRTYAVTRALLVAAVGMLLINPLLLAFDPGFQLSFLATLGLIVGAPIVSSRLGSIRSEFWRELLSATIAAQVSVLPLLLYQTGLFSVVSLPANLLVLPVVPLAMATSTIAGLVGMTFPVLAPLVGLPAYILLSYMLWISEFTSTLPLASFTIPAFPFILVLISYGMLGLLVYRKSGARVRPAFSQEVF